MGNTSKIMTILIITNIVLIMIVISACAPSRVLTRDDEMNNDRQIFSQDDEFDYDDLSTYEDEAANNDKMSRLPEKSLEEDEGEYFSEPNVRNVGKREKPNNWDRRKEKRYYQKGPASWYGREFHGSITASGERFDMNKLTAAHRSLPFGTKLLVKNLENGKRIKVLVNDRGPYNDGRILDLSYAAAKKLDMIKDGEANVGIIVLRKGFDSELDEDNNSIQAVSGDNFSQDISDNTIDDEYSDKDNYFLDDSLDESDEEKYSVQAGAFYSRRNAEKLKRQIEEITENPVVIIREDYMYKIRIKGLSSKGHAKRFKKKLKDEDISSFLLKE